MTNVPTISVIVPFYNIAEYVPYCLDSLINQEYSDYEIVCIDDGSTDSTGSVLDKYEKENERVVVFHKSNGGLSDARNYGVQNSRGKLISFVDGDDVVSPFYLSSLFNALDGMKSCIVMGGFKTLSFNEEVRTGTTVWDKTGKSGRISRRDAFKKILLDRIQPSAWAKLAPRWVYENIPFPTGVRYEEIRTILDYLLQVENYVHLDQKIYGYVMREGSITWSKSISSGQLEEYIEAINIICSKARNVYPDLEEYIRYQRALLDARAHSQLPTEARKYKEIRELDDEIIGDLADCILRPFKIDSISNTQILRFKLLVKARPVYDFLYSIFRKMIKKVG